jgi:hypothetical protein
LLEHVDRGHVPVYDVERDVVDPRLAAAPETMPERDERRLWRDVEHKAYLPRVGSTLEPVAQVLPNDTTRTAVSPNGASTRIQR